MATFSPVCSTHGALMKTACSGPAPAPGRPDSVISRSKESTWRPNAFLRTVMSMPPKVCWPATPSTSRSASMIIPAQDPNVGRPEAISLRSGSRTSKAAESRHSVVDSPPGGVRPPGRAAPRPGRWCSLRTLGLTTVKRRDGGLSSRCLGKVRRAALPAPPCVVLVGREGVQLDADHGLAQAAGDLGYHVRVVVERGGLHDPGGALCGIPGLEDARAA